LESPNALSPIIEPLAGYLPLATEQSSPSSNPPLFSVAKHQILLDDGTAAAVEERRRWPLGLALYFSLCALSCGIFYLLCRWLPRLKHRLRSMRPSDLLQADSLLVAVLFDSLRMSTAECNCASSTESSLILKQNSMEMSFLLLT
jgi:hypothetical protein